MHVPARAIGNAWGLNGYLVIGSGFWLGPSWMIDHAVSDLGTGPGGWLMNVTFLVSGVILGGPGYLLVLLAFLPDDTQPLAHFAVAWTMFGLMGGVVVRRLGLREAVIGVVFLLFAAIGSGTVIGLAERAFFILWLFATLPLPRLSFVRRDREPSSVPSFSR